MLIYVHSKFCADSRLGRSVQRVISCKMLCYKICLALCLIILMDAIQADRSFEIDSKNHQFLLDGKPFRYVSGSMHYYRVHQGLWKDRMRKLKAAGLNAIQTYVEWVSHEPQPGVYNFEGNLNLTDYIKMAQAEGLLVILRPGPYIDSERDMGGLPFWLLKVDPGIRLRTNDKTYTKYVKLWFQKLLPMVKPLLYENGGPIIMVQVENEYGDLSACDFDYTSSLRDLFREELGDNVVLFTTDGWNKNTLVCGKIAEVLATVDFGAGTDVNEAFRTLHVQRPHEPTVVSEFWPGWLDNWGYPHAHVDSKSVANTLDQILAANASVNIYPFEGGTSFGFGSGSIYDGSFKPCPTSYDFDAPLTEAGDPTQKYYDIRKVVGKYLPLPPGPIPGPSPKGNYGSVQMRPVGNLWSRLEMVSEGVLDSDWPWTFEELGQFGGFVLYRTTVQENTADTTTLEVEGLADRGYVFLDQKYVGTLNRMESIDSLPIYARKGQLLDILVENQGRVCYGPGRMYQMNDFKGITTDVVLAGDVLTGWTMHSLPFNNTRTLLKLASDHHRIHDQIPDGERAFFFTGNLTLPDEPGNPMDTFLRLDGWTKGVAFINGFNLGRYWPAMGPQVTLYVPRTVLLPYPQVNTIILFELEEAPCTTADTCEVRFVKNPELNGTTPYTCV